MSYSTHDAVHWNVALMSPELRIRNFAATSITAAFISVIFKKRTGFAVDPSAVT